MGWNSQVHMGFPRKFESANLSRIILVGRLGVMSCAVHRAGLDVVGHLAIDVDLLRSQQLPIELAASYIYTYIYIYI